MDRVGNNSKLPSLVSFSPKLSPRGWIAWRNSKTCKIVSDFIQRSMERVSLLYPRHNHPIKDLR